LLNRIAKGAAMSDGAQLGNSSGKRRFAAFISYAHADAVIAAKLQSKLERYRLPKHIAAAHAEGQAALGQIFRDREDLAAAPSLSHAIQAAISEAEALVVICSPDAKSSRWVGEEIALFRRLHPDGPVLAAIVRGEPADAFPEALTEGGTEPLAADLRPEADGEALGFLKIVAGIAGVPLDALVQRDAQRRLRRVTWITAGALTAMLIMGVMTTFAIQSRNEAARQRAEAEGLVEYMLTDLRGRLEGVGRFDILDAVNERAMKHYQNQGKLSSLPADSLERRARILHAMGEDYEKRDRLNLAREKFSEAHQVTEALLARQPDNPQRIFAHGQSEYWIGRIAERTEDWPAASRHYLAYAAAAKRLIAAQPENPDYMLEMGWGQLNIGIIRLQSRQKPDFGESAFLSATMWMQKAAKVRPDDAVILNEIGNAYAWLADARLLGKDLVGSLAARRLELSSKARIAERNPADASSAFELAKAQYAVAANLLKLDRSTEAKPLLSAASEQMARLIKVEPENREWRIVNINIEELQSRGGKNAN
jgi:MTH538 TIR-like domain (DUF1863)